jgi:hypothetical protein
MYEELKAAKIQQLEGVLAEQAEYAEEQVRVREEGVVCEGKRDTGSRSNCSWRLQSCPSARQLPAKWCYQVASVRLNRRLCALWPCHTVPHWKHASLTCACPSHGQWLWMQVEQSRQQVKHWQAEAERQAKLAQEAGSQGVKDKMAELQASRGRPYSP